MCIHSSPFILYYRIVNKNKQGTQAQDSSSGAAEERKEAKDKADSKKREDKKRKQAGANAGETGWITIPEKG